jgi:hypothetical protein
VAAADRRAVAALYGGLAPTERARLVARLAREHKTDELNRLCAATPTDQAAAYNRAIAYLRALHYHLPEWIAVLHLGMERDRMRLQAATSEGANRWLRRSRLADVWSLVAYPVTETEHRTLVALERAEPEPLDAYAAFLADFDGTEPGLNAEVAALLRALPPDLARVPVPPDRPPGAPVAPEALAEDLRRADAIAARVRRLIGAAVRRGELPKPRRHDGEACLPIGTLSDWGEGTTPDTYAPFGPGHHVPALGELYGGDLARWEVRPDAEAPAVRARRGELRDVFLSLAGRYGDDLAVAPTLDPPSSAAEQARARAEAARLWQEWEGFGDLGRLALDAATAHAAHRAQLAGLAAAVEAVRRDEFGGEDPLWPELRRMLDRASEEAARFDETWATANATTLRVALREAAGLPPYPKRGEGALDEPAPLPAADPDVAGMLELLGHWAGVL